MFLFSVSQIVFAEVLVADRWQDSLSKQECIYADFSSSFDSIKVAVVNDAHYRMRFNALCSKEHANLLLSQQDSIAVSSVEREQLVEICTSRGWKCDGDILSAVVNKVPNLDLRTIELDDVQHLSKLTYVPELEEKMAPLLVLNADDLFYLDRFGGRYPKDGDFNVKDVTFPKTSEPPLSKFEILRFATEATSLVQDMRSRAPVLNGLFDLSYISEGFKDQVEALLIEMQQIDTQFRQQLPLLEKQAELSGLYNVCQTDMESASDELIWSIDNFFTEELSKYREYTAVYNQCIELQKQIAKVKPQIKERLDQKQKEQEYMRNMYQWHVQRVQEENVCNDYLYGLVGIYKCLGEGQSFTVRSPVEAGGCMGPSCGRIEYQGVSCRHSPTSLPTNSPCYDWKFLGFE